MTDFGTPDGSIDETLRRRFESAWGEGHPRPIEGFLPPEENENYLPTLEELVHIELEFAWKSWGDARNGDGADSLPTVIHPPLVETYIERFPQLDQAEIVLRLLQEERFARSRAGQITPIEEYRRRFPQLVATEPRFASLLKMVGPDAVEAESMDAVAENMAPREQLPREFGNYQLLEEIGRGGMGVVYRARQSNADRIVALKLIRQDLIQSLPSDSEISVLDRFRQESQAAARLDHDNIVTVYEVGKVDGEPFFSMHYVEGQSLTEILREGPIPNRRAAGYIEPVARAVEEAHSQGILHRDLKPQNILVDRKHDRPMVADFGLAKLSQSGGEELTQVGEIMGSPPYMSPEQAMDSSGVTAATDIYSLGATFYHILTGRPPFQAATGLETIRQVIDQEPVGPRRLNPSIDRDLETICLKCLQKEPLRRYSSAAELADDISRYLKGEPIKARPISSLQRAVRWCRRNRLVAALIASTSTFLVLALLASVVGYVRTSAALAEAEAGYRQARQTVDDFFTQVSEDDLLNQPGMQPLRRELLEQALEYYRRFTVQRGDDPALQDELALTHFRMGRITELIDSPDAALPSYQLALSIQRKLLKETPDDPDRLGGIGDTLNASGRIFLRRNELDRAQEAYKEAAAIRGKLLADDPGQLEFLRKLANSHMNLALVEKMAGNGELARAQFEKAQTLRRQGLERHPADPLIRRDLGMGYYNLANLEISMVGAEDSQTDRDLCRDAQENFEKSIEIFAGLLRDNPEDMANQHRLVLCCRLLADVKCELEYWSAALELYRRALKQMQSLAGSNTEVPRYRFALAEMHMNLGCLWRERGQPEKATESFSSAVAILRKLVADYPKETLYRRDLAVTLLEDGELKSDAGLHQQARKVLEEARDLLTTLIDQFPDDPHLKSQLDRAVAALKKIESQQAQP